MVYKMSVSRRLVSLLSLGLSLGALVFSLVHFPKEQGFLGFFLIGMLAFWGGFFTVRLFIHSYQFQIEGKMLRRRLGPWFRDFPLEDLISLKGDPSGGTLVVRFPNSRLQIPRRLKGYDLLVREMEKYRPFENNVNPPPFCLRGSKTPLIFYLLLLGFLGIFFLVVNPPSLQSFLGEAALDLAIGLLGLLLTIRILFFLPVKYLLEEEGITVCFLLRKKNYPAAAALRYVEDRYTADGARYRVVKLEFRRKNLVLDEFILHDSLGSLLPWLRRHYGTEADRLF